eukprot:6183036-Pleurochrysis_carterae.AAC.4
MHARMTQSITVVQDSSNNCETVPQMKPNSLITISPARDIFVDLPLVNSASEVDSSRTVLPCRRQEAAQAHAIPDCAVAAPSPSP